MLAQIIIGTNPIIKEQTSFRILGLGIKKPDTSVSGLAPAPCRPKVGRTCPDSHRGLGPSESFKEFRIGHKKTDTSVSGLAPPPCRSKVGRTCPDSHHGLGPSESFKEF